MIKSLWIILLALSCLCCGPTHFQYTRLLERSPFPIRTIPVYVDAAFGNEDLLNIDNSIMRWNYAFNGYVVLTVVSIHSNFTSEEKIDVLSKHGLMIHKVNSKYLDIPLPKNPSLKTIAWTNMINGHEIFLIRDRLSSVDIFPVMLHELGHYFGAEHKQEAGLMNEQYSIINYQCIDLSTIRQVAKFNGLSPLELNYCIEHFNN